MFVNQVVGIFSCSTFHNNFQNKDLRVSHLIRKSYLCCLLSMSNSSCPGLRVFHFFVFLQGRHVSPSYCVTSPYLPIRQPAHFKDTQEKRNREDADSNWWTPSEYEICKVLKRESQREREPERERNRNTVSGVVEVTPLSTLITAQSRAVSWTHMLRWLNHYYHH